MLIRSKFLALAAGVLALATTSAQAAYPEKPIAMIVAYGAGGSIDVTARMLAPLVGKHLGEAPRVLGPEAVAAERKRPDSDLRSLKQASPWLM
jgi:Uncharacterized protein conserved in bacteria